MGCFQSQSNKYKDKSVKSSKNTLGEFNNRWERLLSVKIANQLIKDQIDIEHPCFRSIQKDVDRTFPNEKFFENKQNLKLFTQTLKCFALTFPKIGYTQGLNFLCGYFLLNKMTKDQCLHILTSAMIHPKLMLLGLYEDSFPLPDLYCQMFWKLLYEIDNELYNFLKVINVADHMWIFQWFLTHFLYSFPIDYVTIFLNRVFQNQQFEIVKISIAVILCLKDGILSLKEKDDVAFIEYLERLKNIKTCNKLLNISLLLKKISCIDDSLVNKSLQQISKAKSNKENFYIKYFASQPKQQISLHVQFLGRQKESKVTLEQSYRDSKLMQSYKRNRETVEILDEILQQSAKKQIEKIYRSSLVESKNENKLGKSKLRRCRSLEKLQEVEEKEGEGETTISIVRKMQLSEDSQDNQRK